MLSLDQLIEKARAMRASDVHIVCGLPAKCRVDGNVTDLTGEVLTAADCEMLARELAGAEYETMADIGELDMARSFPDGGRTRVNLFRQQGSVSAAIRLLAEKVKQKMPCFFNKLFCVILCILGSTKRPPAKVPPVAYALSCYFRVIFVCYACVFLLNMNEREQHALRRHPLGQRRVRTAPA